MEAFRGNSEQAVAARRLSLDLKLEPFFPPWIFWNLLSVMQVSQKQQQLKDGKKPTTPLLTFTLMAATLLLRLQQSRSVVLGFICGLRNKKNSACRPVFANNTYISHLPNNVAGLDAILMVLEWVYSHRACISRAVIHYDVENGIRVAAGQWKAMRNLSLVGRIKDYPSMYLPV